MIKLDGLVLMDNRWEKGILILGDGQVNYNQCDQIKIAKCLLKLPKNDTF